MSKHTPGPWSVNQDSRYNGGAGYIVWGLEGPGHGSVCSTNPHSLLYQGEERAEAEANARLIAAAPELLEVCRQATFDLEPYLLGVAHVGLKRLYSDLRIVIAKAEGKE